MTKPMNALQEASDRIKRGEGTLKDMKLIEQKFNEAKWKNIRELKKFGKRTKWLR